MVGWSATVVRHVLIQPPTWWANPSAGNPLTWDKNCQAFVPSQAFEGEADHLGNSPPFLPNHGLSPCLSAHQWVCLAPGLSADSRQCVRVKWASCCQFCCWYNLISATQTPGSRRSSQWTMCHVKCLLVVNADNSIPTVDFSYFQHLTDS